MRRGTWASFSSSLVPQRWQASRHHPALAGATPSLDLGSPRAVAAVLLPYFQHRLGVPNLGFAEMPVAFAGGWETYTYHFRLKSPVALPAAFEQPLTVRIYSGPPGLPRARREFLVQRHLLDRAYPVAAPLLLEEDCTILGAPFLVMTWIRGWTLLRSLLYQPWRLLWAPGRMAQAHVRLHQLSTAGFPALPGAALPRRLDEMATLIDEYGLRGLRPGFDWLWTHQPEAPAEPRILHLDFHPLNLILEKQRGLVVLDWNEADLGDPHADVGTTMTLLDCPPPVPVNVLEQLAIGTGRAYFSFAYLRAYRRRQPLNDDRLAYYRALAAFRRLCFYGRWLHSGPQITGHKPVLLQCITTRHRQALEAYVRKWCGVSVCL